MSSWQSGEVTANGLRLHFTRTGGDKPPLVLAHGFSDDGLCWTPVARALEAEYDVIMVDARGHGGSEAPAQGYDPATQADDLAGGTFTISNVGTFGNVMGTPIIMQPQVGIIAIGAIQKKPAVVETPYGDAIAIRHKMFLSHSYDHRVVDGALGGRFVRRVADILEAWSMDQPF